MAEYVQSGDKIQASQYNALVDAIAGPTNATADQPFTQTKNGVVINGGLGRQMTKAASTVPALFEVSYGDGYVGAGYSTYQQGDIDANRFNGVFLNIGSWDTLAYNGFVLGNGLIVPTVPAVAIIDPTSINAAVVVYNQALADTIAKGKLPLCTADKDAGYAFVQVVDNGTDGKARNGDFVLLVGDFTKLGGSSGSDIKTVSSINIKATISGINLYENCKDVRVVQGGVLWRHNVIAGVAGSNIPHLSYTVGTQYVDMLPDSYVNLFNVAEEVVWSNALMDVKLKSIAVVPPSQMGFSQLQSTNTFELYHFDRLSSDISAYSDLSSEGLSCYDVLVKHKKPHPYTKDDPIYEGHAEADLEYVAVSCLVPPGDTNANKDGTIYTYLSSVELTTIDGNAFYQLFNFDQRELTDFKISDDCDIVLRDYTRSRVPAGAAINYVKLSDFLSALSSTEVDTWATQGAQRSIDWNTQSDKKYLQLYNFDNSGYEDALRVNLVYGQHRYATKDGSGEDPDPYVEFVVRDSSGNRMVKYDALDIYAPPIYASDVNDLCSVISAIATHECSCDLGPLSASLDALSAQLSNYWKVGGTYSNNCYGQSIGDSGQRPQIDLNNGQLLYSNAEYPTLDWHNAYLMSNGGEVRVNWAGCETYDSSAGKAMDWDWRHLYDDAGKVAVRWNNRTLHDSSQLGAQPGALALDWENRTLYDSSNHIVADWERKELLDSNTMPAVDWGIRQLKDSDGNGAVDWNGRELLHNWKVDGNLSLGNGQQLKIGSTTLNETQLKRLLALI